MMPFKISELSNFKNVRTLAPGAAIMLADGDEKTGFEAAPFMIDRPDRHRAGHARRSRPLCPADRDHDSRRARRADHDVRADPHRRPARLRDADRRHQRQGQYAGDDRAMAAVRRPRTRCASSAARRATNGPRRFRASAPCATEFSRAADFAGTPQFSRRDRRQAALRSSGDLICCFLRRLRSPGEMHHVGSTGGFWQVSARRPSRSRSVFQAALGGGTDQAR